MNQTEILMNYRGWLLKTAWDYATDAERARDLAQEGWIAMWRALQVPRPAGVAESTYLMNQARWRMQRCVQRHTWTGMPDRRAEGYGGSQKRVFAADAEFGHENINDLADEVTVADAAAGLEWSYHHGEIMAALDKLTPKQKEHVIRCFWMGERLSGSWWFGPKGIKNRLADELSHLRELVDA